MPEVEIVIGGRSFEVSCQPGEEEFLRNAAQLLDAEAMSLHSQIGRTSEAKMLLMAGLLLADRTAGLEERLRAAEARADAAQTRLAAIEAEGPRQVLVEVPVEVPRTPPEVTILLDGVAAEAEAMARELEELAAR
jgi:cell division protein ZapA